MMVKPVLLVASVSLEHTAQVLQLKHSSTQKRLRRTPKRQLLLGTLIEIDAVTHTRAQRRNNASAHVKVQVQVHVQRKGMNITRIR